MQVNVKSESIVLFIRLADLAHHGWVSQNDWYTATPDSLCTGM